MQLSALWGSMQSYRGEAKIVDLRKVSAIGGDLGSLPFSIRVLLENVIRHYDGFTVREEDVEAVVNWRENAGKREVPYYPERVIMQDFTGVSAILDVAVIRDAFAKLGRDPAEVSPAIPVDLVIDHSVQVDYFGTKLAFSLNVRKEYERNAERYRLFKWAQRALKNFRVVPPGKGIIHQVNLEYLAKVVWLKERGGELQAYPDSLLGTDSHTPMVNALGVFGWGVGGVEAEAVVLGEPNYILLPEVMGIRLEGEPREGVTSTDIALYLTEFIRKKGAVGKFVEFIGPGAKRLSVPDRATIANMAPEYGATMGFFPIDERTLRYLLLTGRSEEHVAFVEAYAKRVGLWYEREEPEYSELHVVDLGEVEPSIAGPANPEDRIPLREAKRRLQEIIDNAIKGKRSRVAVTIDFGSEQGVVSDGMVAIASLTSCTNTSNPSLMIAAGLLAKKAVERGLRARPWVKTSNAPGSRAIIELWERSGLLPYLEALGFHVVGIGCTTCIGNSGPLPAKVEEAIKKTDIYATAVLSGNRNFAGRIHPLTKGSFLASPPLVIAYALAGRVDIDFETEPLGLDPNGVPVYLRDIWPSSEEIAETLERSLDPSVFVERYKDIFEGDENWEKLDAPDSTLYQWSDGVMIRRPPFLDDFSPQPEPLRDIRGARVLVWAPDRTNTDHISPAGRVAADSEAAKYLREKNGIDAARLGLTYGSLRGNHEVMMRGTFDSPGFRNRLVPERSGAWTVYWPTGEVVHIYHAAMRYKEGGTPLLVLAGKQYGMGSSRDWAARGPYLLGVKAVIAESYERIHRSNLVCMGILPLEFMPGENADKLGLKGDEEIDILGIEHIAPGAVLEVVARRKDGGEIRFKVRARLDTPVEVEYFKHGGILKYVLRKMLSERTSP
ncbi:MAG: aconitate hydratase AcnA [Acidilobaceae archaeon]|nr:aconitate hydratase AcnA [Acidilobaceae archaeon]MCX8165330.1 aconitate hydratase AcnA [Acidilobaceae archaeon]